MKTNVGTLRQQTALCDADREVIIVTQDEELKELLKGKLLVVEEFYPDTTDGQQNFTPSFKIRVALKKAL